MEQKCHNHRVHGHSNTVDPRDYSSYLAAKCYKMRNKGDPFYVEAVVAGIKDAQPYLCCVDLYGNQYQDNYITTGIARMLCPTIIDRIYTPNISVAEARDLLLQCFQALYARYSLADREVVLCSVTESGVQEERAIIDIPYNYRGYIHKEDIM